MSPVTIHSQSPAQAVAWDALLSIAAQMPQGWTVVGGQMVLLWCLERGSTLARPTEDIDTVLDVRAHPDAHPRFTGLLAGQGFKQVGETVSGRQHRWARGDAEIDVLIPRFLGERADRRRGAAGGPALPTPGGQLAINRSEPLDVVVDGRQGTISRPSLIGALIAKSSTVEITDDPARERHVWDFLTLLTLMGPRDFRAIGPLEALEKNRLRRMSASARHHAPRLPITGYQIQLASLERLVA